MYWFIGELKDKEMKGIIPRIIEDIYEHSKEEKKVSLNVKVAYFEIYNEVIRDLLDKSKTNLPIHEDKFRSPYVKVSVVSGNELAASE